MADRLQELLQQRALIKEHLAWLEGEISAASGRPAQVPGAAREPATAFPPNRAVRTPAPTFDAVARSPTRGTTATGALSPSDNADAMIASLAAQEKTPPIPTKKGCWIFFCLALVVIGLSAWAALHFFYRE